MSSMRPVPLRLGLVALLTSTLAAQPPTRPAPAKISSTAIRIEYDVRVPMRDGTTLSADVYRPKGDAPVPVILVRTPYDNGAAGHVAEGKRWAARGYAYVVQDVRGRGESDGEFYPLVSEADDGADTIDWLARQPWSTGKVGMMGSSYLGWVQLYAAIRKPAALKALIPTVTPPDPDRNFPLQFGAYEPSTLSWLATLSGKTMQDISEHDLRAVYGHRPLYEADRLLGRTMKVWRDWLDHPTRDAYWEAQSFQQKLEDVSIPMLHISGWYDDVLVGTTENYAITRDKPHQFLLIGPWGHRINRGRKIGAIDFGPSALLDLDAIYERWFDRWLKDIRNGIEDEPRVRYFVMGANQWKTAPAWPLRQLTPTRFYLSSGGHANSRLGDGRLQRMPSVDEPPDHYRADPADPFPFVTDDAFSQIGGPDNYAAVETRKDVLVYTSTAFTAPTTMCGSMTVSLVAGSSARDTDWAAKVLAVRPDGFAWRLNDGIVRARFRNGRRTEQLLTPGAVETYTIDAWSTCIEFQPGWRVRLEIASHAFPKFDVNLQTGGPIGKEVDGVVAEQTVYHDRARQSYVELPIVR
jgi:uncharacterized protein